MVYFHATRSVTMLAAGAVMQFDAIPVSTGQNPFNGATGLFTAPVTGRYQFIFSAVAANYQSQVAVARFSNNAWSCFSLGTMHTSLPESKPTILRLCDGAASDY